MKALIPVLESLGIHSAMSIDDDYALAKEGANQRLTAIDDFLEACGEHLSQKAKTEIEDAGDITVGDLFDDARVSQEVKDQVRTVLKGMDTPLSALRFLESGFEGTSISFQKISAVADAKEKNIEGSIWFLDKEMGEQDVLPLIIPVLSDKYLEQQACLIVVFTSDDSFDKLNDSWEERYAYLSKELKITEEIAKKLSYSFFVISKTRLAEKLQHNECAARQYVGGIVSECLTGYCMYNIITQMKQHALIAYEELICVAKNANQKTMRQIHYNMLVEGEPNAYYAFKNIHSFMQEREYFTQFEEYNRYLLAMKRMARVSGKGSVKSTKNAIQDIVEQYAWAQFQFMHKDVNKSCADVLYGDIFRLQCVCDGEKEYLGVLITQPCDCILREENSRVQRTAKFFTLLLFNEETLSLDELDKLEQKSSDDFSREIRKIRNECVFVGQKDARSVGYIRVTDSVMALQIAPFILDLTSLNIEGKAIIIDEAEFEKSIASQKTQNWGRYTTIRENLNMFQTRLKDVEVAMPQKAEEYISSIYGISYSTREKEFAIERIGHLQMNLVELISYHYVTHTYRTGKDSLLSLHYDEDKIGDT